MGSIDPSMGTLGEYYASNGLGEYVSYQPMAGFGVTPTLPPPALPAPAPAYESRSPSFGRVLLAGIGIVSTGALAYHGYRRNESIGWALVWAILGGGVPIIGWPVALAQGFGKPKRGMTPNRRRSRSSRKRRRRS
jgi:hypothetical protein